MSQTFAVMDVNPNEGGGCLCSEIGTQDTKPPFVVFNATEQESNDSPFPVICAGCLCKAAELVRDQAPKVEPTQPKRRKDRGTGRLVDEDGPSI